MRRQLAESYCSYCHLLAGGSADKVSRRMEIIETSRLVVPAPKSAHPLSPPFDHPRRLNSVDRDNVVGVSFCIRASVLKRLGELWKMLRARKHQHCRDMVQYARKAQFHTI